jgi:hypothetical protein
LEKGKSQLSLRRHFYGLPGLQLRRAQDRQLPILLQAAARQRELYNSSYLVEKYAEKDVFDYNIGLGALLTLAKKLIAHRIANIELRRS